jgi:hypothetical protein
MTSFNPHKAALDVTFYCDDLGEELTVRDYMKRLLSSLFASGEGFSGKRPFGNSGWEYDVLYALIKSGFIAGTYEEDEDGGIYCDGYDWAEFHDFIQAVILEL